MPVLPPACCSRLFVFLSFILLSVLVCLPASAAAFTVNTLGDHQGIAVVEFSGNYDALVDGVPNHAARQAISREFYRSHGDDYDFLVIFTNFDFLPPAPNAAAFFTPVQNQVQGIGLESFDRSAEYSASGNPLARLQGTIDMASFNNYTLEPADPDFENTLRVLAHEFSHRWGAYVHFREENGEESDALLGLDDAHWSYLLNSAGSTLYGNNWQDNGDGTFTSLAAEQGQENLAFGRIFSSLDLYLMGFLDADAVPDLMLLASPGIDAAQPPRLGETLVGTPSRIDIEQIIAAEGERLPTAAEAPRDFRIGYIFAVIPGTWSADEATDLAAVAGIAALRDEWARRFSLLTDGTAIMRTEPPQNVTFAGNPGPETPSFDTSNPPGFEAGIAWLTATQDPIGFWQDRPGTAIRDTAAALTVLPLFADHTADLAAGRNWLSEQEVVSLDDLARRALSLTGTGSDTLTGDQNPDGGWGAASGYQSSPLDTALALQTLWQSGDLSPEMAGPAVQYLVVQQNPDGGWGAGTAASTLQATSRVVKVLQGMSKGFALAEALTRGLAWLTARQNSDGGFGNSASTVHDTAVVLEALQAAGSGPEKIELACDYLLAQQSVSGSWHGSVLQTSLALEVLHRVLVTPDLAVNEEMMTVTPARLETVPGQVTLAAVIANFGQSPVSGVQISLFEGDPEHGLLLGEQRIDLAGNSQVTVPFTVSIDEAGLHQLIVVVDSEHAWQEASEQNNRGEVLVPAALPHPDVAILSPTDGSLLASSPTLEYVVNGEATARLLLDGEPLDIPSGTLLPWLTEGSHALTLEAEDAWGFATSQTVTFTLDRTAPEVAIVSPAEARIYDPHPVLIWNAAEPIAARIFVDGVETSVASGGLLGPLSAGVHRLRVAATDAAGNTGWAETVFAVSAEEESAFLPAAGWPKAEPGAYGGIGLDAEGNLVVAKKQEVGKFELMKYDRAGRQLWAKTTSSYFNVLGSAWVDVGPKELTLDSQGNIFVVGWGLYLDHKYMGFVAKYDPAGNYLRHHLFNTHMLYGDAYAYSVCIGPEDQVYVSGNSENGLFRAETGTISSLFVAMYDNNLNLIQGRDYGGTSSYAYIFYDRQSMAVDDEGHVYITGRGPDSQMFFWKLNPDLSRSGIEFMAEESSYGRSIDLDPLGNIYVAGGDSSGAQLWVFDAEGVLLNERDGFSACSVKSLIAGDDQTVLALDWSGVLRKFSADLSLLWSVENDPQCDTKLVVDRFGDVFIGGSYASNAATHLVRLSDPRIPAFSFAGPMFYGHGDSVILSGHADPAASLALDSRDLEQLSLWREPASGSWRMTVSGLSAADQRLSVAVTDRYGFVRSYETMVIVDDQAPVAIITGPLDGSTVSAPPILTYTVSDGEVRVLVNDLDVTRASGEFLAGLQLGENRIRVEARDAAGNLGSDQISLFAEGEAVGQVPFEPQAFVKLGNEGQQGLIAMERDAAGNLYLLGETDLGFAGYSLPGGHLFVAKYAANLQLLELWQIGNNLKNQARALAVTAEGAFAVAYDSDHPPDGDGIIASNVTVASFDASGRLQWQQVLENGTPIQANALAFEADGKLLVAGYTYGRLNKQKAGGNRDYFLVRYHTDGSEDWTVLSNLGSDDVINAILPQTDGSILAVGRMNDVGAMTLLKLDGQGERLWSRDYATTGEDEEGLLLAADSDGFLYAASQWTTMRGYALCKFDSAGNLLWQSEAGAANLRINDLKLAAGAIHATGRVRVTDESAAFAGNSWYGGDDLFLAGYRSTDGHPLWTRQLGDGADQEGNALSLNPATGQWFLAGSTFGIFGGENFGGRDLLLARLGLLAPVAGPELEVLTWQTPTTRSEQTLFGRSTPEALVSARITAPAVSGAVPGPVRQYQDGSWEVTVTNLMVNADNRIEVLASDQNRTTRREVDIVVDQIPPLLSVNPPLSPTETSSQMISGTIEPGAELEVASPPEATGQTVPVTNGFWQYQADNLAPGDNQLVFTARDAAGNVTSVSAVITYTPPPPLALTITPGTILASESLDVYLEIGNLAPGAAVTIEQNVDLDHDGMVDSEEPVVRRVVATDGQRRENPNLVQDLDGVADGRLVLRLPHQRLLDRLHTPGDYLIRAFCNEQSATVSFEVQAVPRIQGFSGVVSDEFGKPVGGALVVLTDRWGRPFGYAFADRTGIYRFDIDEPGVYMVQASAEGYWFAHSSPVVELSSGENRTGVHLTLNRGPWLISGKVMDHETGQGLAGMLVRAEGWDYTATALTGEGGSYSLSLPAGEVDLFLDDDISSGPSAQGYLAGSAAVLSLSVTGDNGEVDIFLQPADEIAIGRVVDAAGTPVPGLVLRAEVQDGGGQIAVGGSSDSGDFALGLISGPSWRVSVADDLTQPLGLVGTQLAEVFSAAETDTILPPLVIYPIDAKVRGTMTDAAGDPVAAVPVRLSNLDAGTISRTRSGTDGSFSLGINAGNCELTLLPEEQVYLPLEPHVLTLEAGQTQIQDFTLHKPQPSPITIVSAVYNLRKRILSVRAATPNADEALYLEDFGPMIFVKTFKGDYIWEYEGYAGTAPATVTVSGASGSVSGEVGLK